MPALDKNSARQQILNLPIGETVGFPVVKMKSIRCVVAEFHKITENRYTTTTTSTEIMVTCVSRPENKLS